MEKQSQVSTRSVTTTSAQLAWACSVVSILQLHCQPIAAFIVAHSFLMLLPLPLRLADLACVYHLGQDNGTVITGNLCTNVSSHGYGGDAYYTDQGSQNVNISSNVAYGVKCAGFQENFGMDNAIVGNVFAFVNTNKFTPHADHGAGANCLDGFNDTTTVRKSFLAHLFLKVKVNHFTKTNSGQT